jgi:CubicO group peptidase (beta-lactamase class C family)
VVAALLIERLTGRPYGVEINERILRPLHLNQTTRGSVASGRLIRFCGGFQPAIDRRSLRPNNGSTIYANTARHRGPSPSTALSRLRTVRKTRR